MNNVDKCIVELNDLFMAKKHREVIKHGLKMLSMDLTPNNKAGVCGRIAVAFGELDNIKEFIHWNQKAIDCLSDNHYVSKVIYNGNNCFFSHYLSELTDEELAAIHFKNQEYAEKAPWLWTEEDTVKRLEENKHDSNRKIRIGYMSPEYGIKVNTCFSIQLMAAYDRNKFEVYAYNLSGNNDEAVQHLKPYVTVWRDLNVNDSYCAAQEIYKDKLDILVDLSIFSGAGKTVPIAIFKPAPVIMAAIGYMSTSGVKAIDYFLTDVYCDPPGHGDEHFSEKLYRLPHTHFSYTPMERVQNFKVNEKIHEHIVFGCLNKHHKYNSALLKSWKRIMDRVPDCRFMLQTTEGVNWKENMTKMLNDAGIDLSRISFHKPGPDYFATYNEIDICLDTYPYTGGGTTCDALYMGVPVVSRYGTRHGNRFGYSLLSNMGLEMLTADSWERYEDIAVALANDRELLEEIHKNLRTIMENSHVMNYRQYVKEVETCYEEIWQEWMEKNKRGR